MMDKQGRRNPVVACLLSLLVTGLGQLYSGKPLRGVAFLAGLWSIIAILGLAGLAESLNGLIAFVVLALLGQVAVAVDAVFCSIKEPEIGRQWYNKWYVYIIVALIVSLGAEPPVADLLQRHVLRVRTFKMPASTMEPTLVPGDHFLLRLQPYEGSKPERGDVVVFIYPEDRSKFFVKRVVGLEGEKIEIKDKKVFADDRRLSEPYAMYFHKVVMPKNTSPRDNYGPVVVPKESVFVLGDNRDFSHDSRFWGFVDTKDIEGKALFIYWSRDRSRVGREISSRTPVDLSAERNRADAR